MHVILPSLEGAALRFFAETSVEPTLHSDAGQDSAVHGNGKDAPELSRTYVWRAPSVLTKLGSSNALLPKPSSRLKSILLPVRTHIMRNDDSGLTQSS